MDVVLSAHRRSLQAHRESQDQHLRRTRCLAAIPWNIFSFRMPAFGRVPTNRLSSRLHSRCRQGAPTSSDILSSGLRSDSEYLGTIVCADIPPTTGSTVPALGRIASGSGNNLDRSLISLLIVVQDAWVQDSSVADRIPKPQREPVINL